MNGVDHYDVIVVGIGSMGSSACAFLAQRGHRVLGLEQFQIVHEKGSHFGQSRIIRKAYFEHPDYVPLLQRAYHNWKDLERQTNSPVYHQTGIVYFGQPGQETIKGIRRSASLYDVQIQTLSKDETRKRFPTFVIPPDFEGLFEPDAGFVTPERAIALYTEEAIRDGATIKTNTKVRSWKQTGRRIEVTTEEGIYSSDKLIITAGSWTAKVIPNFQADLKVTRQTLAWVNPKNPEAFSLGNFPCWFIEDLERGMFYGFPVLPFEKFGGPIGLKLASHRQGQVTDPDNVVRKSTPADEEDIRYALSKYIPDAGEEIITVKTCLYTYSEDENFIIDHLPGYEKRVTVACGFSGHGFKFVSVAGEILADLAVKGKTELPVDFLGLNRFAK